MYHNSPKLMLKIDLEGEKDLKILLILLDKYYSEHYLDKKIFIASNGFTIYRGSLFTVFKAGVLHLPNNFMVGDTNVDKVSFISDRERYEFLKKMQSALLEWSKSPFWEDFTEKSRIKLTYKDKLWLLF